MHNRFDSWESYFYPPPDDGTLRNKLDERDAGVLSRIEYVEAFERERQLSFGEVSIPRTFDGAHLCALRRHIFSDVYEWAGQFRTVNIAKGPGGGFADVASGQIDRYLDDVHKLVLDTDWPQLHREQFAVQLATVFAYLNQAHPFREGNGRTAKVFLQQVADLSAWRLDYTRVTPEVWNQGSELSGPDLGSYLPVPDSLVPVFRAIVVERAP